MKHSATHTFTAPIEQVWAMFTNEAAHVAKFTSMGHRDIEVLDCTFTDGVFRIQIQRLVDVDLPGFAKKVLKPTNTVISIDEWRDNGDGTYGGTFELDTPGAPVEIRGTTEITAQNPDTFYRVEFALDVKVPIIGGKISNWAGADAEKQLQMEFDAGDAWLAGSA